MAVEPLRGHAEQRGGGGVVLFHPTVLADQHDGFADVVHDAEQPLVAHDQRLGGLPEIVHGAGHGAELVLAVAAGDVDAGLPFGQPLHPLRQRLDGTQHMLR